MSTRLFRIQEWEQLAQEADFQPSKMAPLCGVSLRQLERFFKEHRHTTPSYWLRQLQCRLGKQLIAEGFSTKATAAELKFGSDSHFCREFKKMFMASPQAFSPTFIARHKNVVIGQ